MELPIGAASGTDRLLLTGELAAERAVEIVVPDVGIQPLEIRWTQENGTEVGAGEKLFELDNSDLAEQLESRRVAVLEASAQIASVESTVGSKVAEAEFALEQRRAEHEKATVDAAIPVGLRSAEVYERLQVEKAKAARQVADAERLVETARASAAAEIERERLRLGKQQADMRQVEAGIARLAVTAPIPGVALLGRNAGSDRMWRAGDAVYPGHLLATLPDLSSMIVRARLFDVDDGTIEPGMVATVTLDAHPTLSFGGRIRAIDRMAFQRAGGSATRVFWVTVDLESIDLERMRPGMSARVAVERRLEPDPGARVVSRDRLDLTDLAHPRERQGDGSWRAVALGACSARECIVEASLEPAAANGGIGASAAGGS